MKFCQLCCCDIELDSLKQWQHSNSAARGETNAKRDHDADTTDVTTDVNSTLSIWSCTPSDNQPFLQSLTMNGKAVRHVIADGKPITNVPVKALTQLTFLSVELSPLSVTFVAM